MDISKYVLLFEECDLSMVQKVGGKCASLGELMKARIPVPPGFAITTDAYELFLDENGLTQEVTARLKNLDESRVDEINQASSEIRARIEAGTISEPLEDIIADQYRSLAKRARTPAAPVAVRSSATAEDLPDASFAGQQDTYLWVRGVDDLLGQNTQVLVELVHVSRHFVQDEDGVRPFQGPDQRSSPEDGPVVYRRGHVHSEPFHR